MIHWDTLVLRHWDHVDSNNEVQWSALATTAIWFVRAERRKEKKGERRRREEKEKRKWIKKERIINFIIY